MFPVARMVTKQEMKVRKAYYAACPAGSLLAEEVYCFKCDSYWISDFERPDACAKCGIVYSDYGEYCKPDILLMTPTQQGKDVLGVVRIDDENLHKKNKKHRMHDYNQTELLEKRGVKVFILYNEEVDDYYPWRLYAIARFFWECLTNEHLYKLYRADKDIIQRFAK